MVEELEDIKGKKVRGGWEAEAEVEAGGMQLYLGNSWKLRISSWICLHMSIETNNQHSFILFTQLIMKKMAFWGFFVKFSILAEILRFWLTHWSNRVKSNLKHVQEV